MADYSSIRSDGFADGGRATSGTMSTSTTRRPNSARNLTWQPTQGIVFATPTVTQKDLYSTEPNKRRNQGAQDTNTKSPISTTASGSPESPNKAQPVWTLRPRGAVSHPPPNPATSFGIPVGEYGGICTPEVADLGREHQLRMMPRPQEQRLTPGVERQAQNDAHIRFEDASGSDAETKVGAAILFPRQQRAAKLARLEDEKVQKEINRRLEHIEMRSRSEKRVSVNIDAKNSVQKTTAELDAAKKKADTMSRNVESMARIENVVNKIETMKKKENKIAPTVGAQRKATKEKVEKKRRNAEAQKKATTFENPPIVPNLFFTSHTLGFASSGQGRGRVLVVRGVRSTLYDFKKLHCPRSPEELAKAYLLQERKRLSFPRLGGGAPPPVPETEGRYDRLIFDKVYKGFRAIDDLASRLAAARWCSRRVRLTCEDINDAVDIWKMELAMPGHQYRLVHRLHQQLIRCSQMSGTEQILNLISVNEAIRHFNMVGPFQQYSNTAHEISLSLKMLARFKSRWRGRASTLHMKARRKSLDHSSMEMSMREYLEIVGTRRRDASLFTRPLEKSLRMFDTSMYRMSRIMSSLFCYWKGTGLLHKMNISSRRLLFLRRRILLLRREMRDDEENIRASVHECIPIGSRRTEHSLIAPTDLAHVSDHKWKDVEEADLELSARTSNLKGTLSFSSTSKLNSRYSAIRSPNSDVEALVDVIECTSMVYQIPEEVMREAMLASSSTGAAYWQYSLYQDGGDISGDKVKVHYCTSKETTERIAQLFLDKEVVGFDIEWKPQAQVGEGIKKNVSLIQLASEERIALFHIARYGKDDTIDDLLAPSLKKIMESSEISKVGVSVKADCTRLRRFLGIEARGLFELSHLYKLIKHFAGDVKKINKMLVSLAQQVEEHLQLPMWKGEVRSSDWSQKLNYEQIKYAASDSYAGLRLYDVMEGKRKTLEPTPPRPAHAELNLPIILANGKTVATYDEPDESNDEKPTEDASAHPADLEEMARDFQDIELEDSEIKPSTTFISAARGSKKSPEITAAETWVTDWRSKLPPGYKPRAMPSQLRAYAVWNELGKEVSEVAGILREPPLQVTTVANYILEAIRLEKLSFQEHRLAKVWELLPARSPARGWRPQGGK